MKTYTETVYEIACLLSEIKTSMVEMDLRIIQCRADLRTIRESSAYQQYLLNSNKSEKKHRAINQIATQNSQEVLRKYGFK